MTHQLLPTHGGRVCHQQSLDRQRQIGRRYPSHASVLPSLTRTLAPLGLPAPHNCHSMIQIQCRAGAPAASGSRAPAAKRYPAEQVAHKRPRQTDAGSFAPIRRPRTVPDYDVYTGSAQPWDLPTGLAVTWLGTSSGAPTRDRNISCTVVRYPESLCLVDTGEGTFRQLQSTGLDPAQVGFCLLQLQTQQLQGTVATFMQLAHDPLWIIQQNKILQQAMLVRGWPCSEVSKQLVLVVEAACGGRCSGCASTTCDFLTSGLHCMFKSPLVWAYEEVLAPRKSSVGQLCGVFPWLRTQSGFLPENLHSNVGTVQVHGNQAEFVSPLYLACRLTPSSSPISMEIIALALGECLWL